MTHPAVQPTRAAARRHGSVRPARRALRRVGQVVSWAVILGATAAVVLAVLVPRLGGATPYAILTGSMGPDLPAGTLVVARPVEPRDVGVGTVLTYQRASGRPEVVTHRVVAVSQGPDGQPRWRTRGDANDAVDVGWVRPVQVRGELWYAVPQLGRVSLLLSAEQRRGAAVVVGGSLLGYAVLVLGSAVRERFRRGRPVVAA